MTISKSIYEVVATDKKGDIAFEIKTIDINHATYVFKDLCECSEVATAEIINTVTGEVLAEYKWR